MHPSTTTTTRSEQTASDSVRQAAKKARENRLMELWQQFNTEYETEGHCVEALFERLMDGREFRCRYCSSADINRQWGARFGRCGGCGRNVHFTAGTFFDGIKLVRPWLASIWLIEHGMVISANRLHELVDVAYSSAWEMLRKISLVLHAAMKEEDSALSVSSACFLAIVSRRSRSTPAEQHPQAEQKDYPSLEGLEQQALVLIATSMDFIHEVFQGISRKYLQTYLAIFWCWIEQRCWGAGALLKACCLFRYVSTVEVLAFRTPPMVRLLPGD